MNRERIAWSVSLLLLTLAAFHVDRSLANRDDDYAFVRTLVDIHRQVAQNYVDPVDEGKLQQAAIDGMLSQLDPFTTYVPPAKKEEFDRMLEGTFKGVGIQLNELPSGDIEVVTPIDGSPAHRAGVLAGDIIQKVNGESIKGMKMPDVIKRITGEIGTQVTLTVKHDTGQEVDLTMKRDEVNVPTVKGYRRKADGNWNYWVNEDPKIAFVHLTQFTPSSADAMRDVLTQLQRDGMKGLILDLRYNPGGQLDQAVKIVDMLIDKGTIVVTKGRNRPEEVRTATKAGTLPYFPLIVLVNEHSASASEIVAGSLMDNHRAVVLGTRTYGKGSVQELIPLEGNNGELKLTVAYYYLPSGRLVHKKKGATDWGVEPQINVPMDDEAQKRMQQERLEAEAFQRPTSTRPSTNPASRIAKSPATQPADVQLQRAVDTMLATLIFNRGEAPMIAIPATRPAATQPVN